MPDSTATLESASAGRFDGEEAPALEAMVVMWSAEEPSRVGEVVLFPPAGERRSFVFGRGEGNDGRHERARLVRQRPGKSVEMPPLESNHLSRSQLVARSHPDGGIALQNVGKRALVVAGKSVDECRARTGELVEIGRQMVLLCVRRPPTFLALRAAAGAGRPFEFGRADAFGYVGESVDAWNLRDEVALVAPRREHVLVLGESGSGKELVAQAIHALGPRAGRRFVARSAATVPSGIIDAELFGSAANYPNAGMPERPGLVGEADGSTLFLDEIGELPVELQTHLLRLMDGGDYQRLGDARRRTADLRVVAATNRPATQLKADLAARFPLRVRAPGLHERREDVALVAQHLLREMVRGGDAHIARFADANGEPRMSSELAVALVNHLYTTHVRELAGILVRAALESRGDVVELTAGAAQMLGLSGEEPAEVAREVARDEIVAALERHGGVREKVWRDLGLANRYVLKRLMKKHGLVDGEDG
jgi:two-component system nitrogen regulation response regulator GlnG/two-component system response regulator HydG